MIEIFHNPRWFFGLDAIFEFVSLLASVLLSFYSWKVYKLTKKDSYKIMSIAFIFMSSSFAIRIAANVIIHFLIGRIPQLVSAAEATRSLININIILQLGVFFYRFTFLLGVLLLLLLTLKIKNRVIFILFIMFVFFLTYFSTYAYFIYYLISSAILFFIFSYFLKNYEKRRSKTSYLVAVSFLFIFLSQLVFIFLKIHQAVYGVAKILQLIGFLLLLINYITILRK